MTRKLGDAVRRQIEALDLRRDKPMIICDVDEVVVHFIRSLEAHLDENGCWLDTSSFALNGNIRTKETNEPVPGQIVGDLLYGCFSAKTHLMDMIEGAAEALCDLGEKTEIVMLTNLPHDYLDQRVENLRGHGIPFPVVANDGAKGPAVEALLDGAPHDAIFIDDSANNIVSVADWCPHTHLIHFIPDQRFARHVPPIDRVALRTDNWPEAKSFIDELVAPADTDD